ncbi:hypothetical protein [Pteropox virus]|uniref:Uncharacterized protein n=1 Tax=Pteropox virus TaxID=1873698 RepID=A0A1B1MRD3_9POXV|nr:hypothetical protein [Pteropox virus]ANS71123.1 hypothetical protein [Pteropox virus]
MSNFYSSDKYREYCNRQKMAVNILSYYLMKNNDIEPYMMLVNFYNRCNNTELKFYALKSFTNALIFYKESKQNILSNSHIKTVNEWQKDVKKFEQVCDKEISKYSCMSRVRKYFYIRRLKCKKDTLSKIILMKIKYNEINA